MCLISYLIFRSHRRRPFAELQFIFSPSLLLKLFSQSVNNYAVGLKRTAMARTFFEILVTVLRHKSNYMRSQRNAKKKSTTTAWIYMEKMSNLFLAVQSCDNWPVAAAAAAVASFAMPFFGRSFFGAAIQSKRNFLWLILVRRKRCTTSKTIYFIFKYLKNKTISICVNLADTLCDSYTSHCIDQWDFNGFGVQAFAFALHCPVNVNL